MEGFICQTIEKNQEEDSTRRLQTSRHRIFRIIPNNGTNKKKLLVARNKKQYKGLHPEMFQVSTK